MSEYDDSRPTVYGLGPGRKVFQRFTLTRELGRGGMGVVWQARDEKLERDVALKFLPASVAGDPEAISDLKRETRRALALTHARIVRIFDFLQDEHHVAISMELVDGSSLAVRKLAEPNRHFEAAALAPLVHQLCEALDYAHREAKIVHRDLKPANVMVTNAGDVKVTDFGIAATLTDTYSRTQHAADATSGTAAYMSPQQMCGQKPTVTDDIYSLGATIYELLTGKPPFHTGRIEMQVMELGPPAMAKRRAEFEIAGEPIPLVWEETIAACLAKEPVLRPQSAREVTERLGLANGQVTLAGGSLGTGKVESGASTDTKLPKLKQNAPASVAADLKGQSTNSTAKLFAGIATAAVVLGVVYYYTFHAPQQHRDAVARLEAERAEEVRQRSDQLRLAESRIAQQLAETQRAQAAGIELIRKFRREVRQFRESEAALVKIAEQAADSAGQTDVEGKKILRTLLLQKLAIDHLVKEAHANGLSESAPLRLFASYEVLAERARQQSESILRSLQTEIERIQPTEEKMSALGSVRSRFQKMQQEISAPPAGAFTSEEIAELHDLDRRFMVGATDPDYAVRSGAYQALLNLWDDENLATQTIAGQFERHISSIARLAAAVRDKANSYQGTSGSQFAAMVRRLGARAEVVRTEMLFTGSLAELRACMQQSIGFPILRDGLPMTLSQMRDLSEFVVRARGDLPAMRAASTPSTAAALDEYDRAVQRLADITYTFVSPEGQPRTVKVTLVSYAEQRRQLMAELGTEDFGARFVGNLWRAVRMGTQRMRTESRADAELGELAVSETTLRLDFFRNVADDESDRKLQIDSPWAPIKLLHESRARRLVGGKDWEITLMLQDDSGRDRYLRLVLKFDQSLPEIDQWPTAGRPLLEWGRSVSHTAEAVQPAKNVKTSTASTGNLPHVRYNEWLTRMKAIPWGTLTTDEFVKRRAALLAEWQQLPGAGAKERWLAELETIAAQDGAVDFAMVGPGLRGWTWVETPDARLLSFRWEMAGAEPQRLDFRLIEPVGGRPVYLCTTELPVGLLLRWAEDKKLWTDLLAQMQNMVEAHAKRDARRGPRVYGFGVGRLVRISSWLTRPNADYYPEAVGPPRSPDGDSPLNYFSPRAAALLAESLGCRLPTVAEWKAALAMTKARMLSQIGLIPPNRRDATWLRQRDYVASWPAGKDRQYPDEDAFLPMSMLSLAGAPAAVNYDDQTLWFRRVGEGAPEAFVNLIGNVAEIVTDGAGYAVVGASALSFAGIDVETPHRVDASAAYADVGVRLAFTVDRLTPGQRAARCVEAAAFH